MKTVLLFLFMCLFIINSKGLEQFEDDPLHGNIHSISDYSYDASEKYGIPNKDHFAGKNITIFDDNGIKKEVSCYGPMGNLSGKIFYKYDSNGVKLEMASYASNGDLSFKDAYKYDNVGNVIQVTGFDGDGKITDLTTNVYDEIGNLIEAKEQCYTLNYTSKTLFRYNEYGFVTEKLGYDSNGTLISTTRYEYDGFDSRGNWTIRRIYDGFKLYLIDEREIIYHI